MSSYISAIILAAGTSSRMGKTKQILNIGDRTILEHVIHRSLAVDFSKIITVIGHEASKIKKTIFVDDQRFGWILNKDYRLGLSTSLKLGIECLPKDHSNLMVFLGDLPFISTDTINYIYRSGMEMIQETEETFIIRPHYNGIPGHPVFLGNLDRTMLRQLQGDEGAKSVMNRIHTHKRLDVKDRGILLDIDNPEDYEFAKRSVKHEMVKGLGH